ncbi:AMP-binding protein [Nocardioides sp. AN3]
MTSAAAGPRAGERGRGAARPSYADACGAFSWERARERMAGLPGGGLNIAHEAVDRHVSEGRGARTAIRAIAEDGRATSVDFEELRERTNRFASVLSSLGVGKGERVMSLLGRGVDQYVAAIGTLKHRAVFSPLFSSFGPEPIRDRLLLGRGAVLVTTPALYRRKVLSIRAGLPDLRHVLLTSSPESEGTSDPATIDLAAAMAAAEPEYSIGPTDPEDMALLHFTSGTTGKPKAAIHVHDAVVAHHATAAYALDLHPEDVFWCTADPGWVTGTSYGIIAPLTHGATLLSYAGEFEPHAWYRLLEQERVNVWYTAPTALRMLMRHGVELARGHHFAALRHIASVGEALNPEVVEWGEKAYGLSIHDNWWQTETGAIMISNYRGMPLWPGSMGRPVPGVEATVLTRGPDGRASVVDGGSGSRLPARSASWPFAPAGRRCSAATSETSSATGTASPEAGTSAATWPGSTTTATSGSWDAPTT